MNFSTIYTNIIELILLNIFFIIATYTDCKSYKIYNKFNLIMLLTRLGTFVYTFITNPSIITIPYIMNYIFGALIMFFAFLIPAMITMDSIGGDIKFAFNIGLWVGINPALFLSLLASIFNFAWRLFISNENKKSTHIQKTHKKGIFLIFKAVKRLPLAPFFYLGYLCLLAYYFLS